MEWQPIETAPKDGTILIGKIPNESPDLNREIKWAFGWCSLYKWEWAGMRKATWLKLNEEHQPTHWQPLPKPPQEEYQNEIKELTDDQV